VVPEEAVVGGCGRLHRFDRGRRFLRRPQKDERRGAATDECDSEVITGRAHARWEEAAANVITARNDAHEQRHASTADECRRFLRWEQRGKHRDADDDEVIAERVNAP
jgi:hypothetical protein